MPKIVEFLGPSGVGKSSLYHAVRNVWTPQAPWVTYHDLLARKKKFPGDYYRILVRRLRKIFPAGAGSGKKSKMDETWGFLDGDEHAFLRDRDREFTSVMMDLVNEHCRRGFDGSDRRFVTVYMMMWSIAHVNTVVSVKGDNRPCLLFEGEGFLSRIMHLNSPSFDEDALMRYLSVAPRPDILFHLDSSPEKIVERVLSRQRVSTLHSGMDEQMIYEYTVNTQNMMKIACEYASKAGVRVFQINTEEELDKNVEQIVGHLEAEGQ